MPHYKIITHYADTEASFSNVADEKIYGNANIPDASRTSTTDSVFMGELQAILSAEYASKVFQEPDEALRKKHAEDILKEHEAALIFLYKTSYAFKTWNHFQVEYAPVVLALHNQTELTKEIYQIIHNITAGGFQLQPAIAQRRADTLKASVDARTEQLLNKTSAPFSHADYIINDFHGRDYFSNLGITEHSRQSPQDALIGNFNTTNGDPLFHVRECEEIHCTLNHQESPETQALMESMPKQILELVSKVAKDKDKTIFYGGFASGLLLRDLQNIKTLIDAGYKNIKLLFVDTAYTNLLRLTQDSFDLSLEEKINVNTQLKALHEFSSWLATHVNTSEDNPLSIHLFSHIEVAKLFLETQEEKLTILVAEDIFTKDGTPIKAQEMPTAHRDFMDLARGAIGNDGCFFELIKNDNENKVYQHMGLIQDKRYVPFSTRIYEPRANMVQSYLGTSLGFFTNDVEDPVRCNEGGIHTHQQIIPKKR